MPVSPAVPLKAQPASPDSADVLLLQQVKLLYAGLPVSQAVTLLNGVVLAAVQSVVIEPPRVIAWLAALMLVAVARIVLGSLFRRAWPSSDEIFRWRAYFLAGAVASGMVWGSTAFVLYPESSLAHQVFIAFVLGGMVVGAMVQLMSVFQLLSCSHCARCCRRSYVISSLEITSIMRWHGWVCFSCSPMLVMGKRIHCIITASLQLRFENRELIVHLTSSKERVESSNRDLLAAQEALKRSNEVLESSGCRTHRGAADSRSSEE